MQFNNVYRNKKVLVTGSSGFKGTWLVLWLTYLGAKVYGIDIAENYINETIQLAKNNGFSEKN